MSTKIKYIYDVYHLLDSFPTEEDVHFQVVKWLRENDKIEEEFSDKGIKNVLERKMEYSKLQEKLESLVSLGYLKKGEVKDQKSMYKVLKTEF